MIQNAHIICYSGGEASALAAIEVSRKHGTRSLILLNHDIIDTSEDADVKRFKNEIAGFIGVPVTYANMPGWERKDQFDVVVEAGAFKVGNGTALCTNRMKTEPFNQWLKANQIDQTSTIYYGFDFSEKARIQRRIGILGALGYRTAYPLTWERTIKTTSEIGVLPPVTYGVFRHANCCRLPQGRNAALVYRLLHSPRHLGARTLGRRGDRLHNHQGSFPAESGS